MILAFFISVAGCWGALMVLAIFGIAFWNAAMHYLNHDKCTVKTSRKKLSVINAVISLLFNITYFTVVMTQ